jgi:pimeloyl-ACP methyl ester carboxylesterase
MRDLVRHDIERARDFAARQNHDLLTEGESPSAPLSSITAPTHVIHGTADPMFPSSIERRSLTRSPMRDY